MRHLRANLLIESAAEVTIEVNPISATEAKLESYLRDGFNRLSVGIQSFNDPQLKVMGRPHRQSDVESLLSIIAKQKWINWSVDIMFGIPGQTLKDVEGDIRRLIEIAPPHISCFRLEVIPFTVLKLREFAGLLPQRLSEQTLLEMQELITCLLESAGYRHYGAFNYALPGFESVHNKIAFTAPQGEYIGFGNSAYSYINDAIYCNHADIDAYTSAVVSAGNGIVLSKAVSSREKMSRYFVLGLKFFEVSRSRFIDIFGIDPAYHFGDALTKLASEDLIDIQGDIYTLTKKGKYYVNNVCKEFYTDENKNRSQFPQFAPTITRKQVEKYASLASQK
jgi:oxygen-independent coproporphyrinogen-3 oxidase